VKFATRTLYVLIPFLLFGVLAIAQVPQFSPFSADIQITSTNPNAPQNASGKIFVGNNHMRLNLNSGGHETAIITDFATRTVDILMIEPKMYIEHKVGAMSRLGFGGNPSEELKPFDPQNPCANQPDITCKKIGVETVNGRTCDHWEITGKDGKVSNVWVDEKLHFPIKMTSPDSTIVMSNIKEGQPDAALFQIPSDFHKMNVSGTIPQGMAQPPQN